METLLTPSTQFFKMANETDKYRILIGAYNGTAGDSLNYHK